MSLHNLQKGIKITLISFIGLIKTINQSVIAKQW